MNKGNKSKLWNFRIPTVVVVSVFITIAGPLDSEAETGDSADDASKALLDQRDPFWPVGYTPAGLVKIEQPIEAERPVVHQGWGEAMKQIVINGVSSKGKDNFYAVINGQIKSEGETISVKLGDTVYSWVVSSIKPPSSVKLRRVSGQ